MICGNFEGVHDHVEHNHGDQDTREIPVCEITHHELASPHTAEHNALQVVSDDFVEVLEEKLNETFVGEVVDREVEGLDDLTGDLMALAALVAGNDVLVEVSELDDDLGQFVQAQSVEVIDHTLIAVLVQPVRVAYILGEDFETYVFIHCKLSDRELTLPYNAQDCALEGNVNGSTLSKCFRGIASMKYIYYSKTLAKCQYLYL